MSNSMLAQDFVLEHGRGLNNASDLYHLPADDEEMERLQKQHLMLRELLGKYPPILKTILADDTPGETKAALDLGCGSGGWIMELALDFPHVSCVAVDLVPLKSVAMSPNCRNEVADVNLGLERYYGRFNVVHSRGVAVGVKDYTGYIDHISRALRPGGLMYLAEFDFHTYDANKEVHSHTDANASSLPWFARWVELLATVVNARGGNTEVPSKVFQWVLQHPDLEDVSYCVEWLPTSPWMQGDDPESVRQRWIGARAREDVFAVLKSGRPLLLEYGVSEELLKEVEENTIRELKEAKVQCYTGITVVTARKKNISRV